MLSNLIRKFTCTETLLLMKLRMLITMTSLKISIVVVVMDEAIIKVKVKIKVVIVAVAKFNVKCASKMATLLLVAGKGLIRILSHHLSILHTKTRIPTIRIIRVGLLLLSHSSFLRSNSLLLVMLHIKTLIAMVNTLCTHSHSNNSLCLTSGLPIHQGLLYYLHPIKCLKLCLPTLRLQPIRVGIRIRAHLFM